MRQLLDAAHRSRLGCSAISCRHPHLDAALATIAELGSVEIDLGALPGVCDHVPYILDPAAVGAVAAAVERSGLRVRSINGHLNQALDPRRERPATGPLTCSWPPPWPPARPPGAALRGTGPHPARSLDADLDLVAAELIAAAKAAHHRGVECVDRVAALPTVVLEPPTGSAARVAGLPAQSRRLRESLREEH